MGARARCRHTVADWHRFVKLQSEVVPVFAGCRLLVKEGELASDPRSIACAYWGRQTECPLYDGLEGSAKDRGAGPPLVPAEVPVKGEEVWPVRAPDDTDGMRLVLMGLGFLSILLLGWTAVLALRVWSGETGASGALILALTTAAFSIVTHVLVTLRLWVRG